MDFKNKIHLEKIDCDHILCFNNNNFDIRRAIVGDEINTYFKFKNNE